MKEWKAAWEKPGFNYQMCILSVIGICFVVFGHLRNDLSSLGTFYGWFPYYSFHMPLFLFISGYFFRNPAEKEFGLPLLRFLRKKALSLLVPYYVINGLFLLLNQSLTGLGFACYPYTPLSFLLMPLSNCQPVTWSIPTWFLPALFLTELYYYLLRKLANVLFRKALPRESILLFLTVLIAAASFYCKVSLNPTEAVTVQLRSLVMMFYLHLGYLYRNHLESRDTLSSGWYFLILGFLQFVLLVLSKDSFLSYGLYNLSNFGRTGWVYFAAGITGILLWLRISKLLAGIPKRSRFIIFVGTNTKYIMAFHLFGFFLLNTIFYLLRQSGIADLFLTGFQADRYFADVLYYNCATSNPRLLILYFLAGMGVSLGLAKIIETVKKKISRHIPAKNT